MFRVAFQHGLWCPTYNQLFYILRCLRVEDQEAAFKFAYQRDVKSHIMGRALVLFVAKQLLNMDPQNVTTARDDYGRPIIQNSPNFDFNLSHHGDFTIITSYPGVRTGCDVMKIESPPASTSVDEFLRKMRSIFASSEWAYLNERGLDETEKMRRFFRLWCLKEAFVKNIGSGLRIDISTVNFDISGPEVLCRHSEIRKEEWKFEEHQLNENHIAAVAWHTSGSISAPPATGGFQLTCFEALVKHLEPWNEPIEAFWSKYQSKVASPPSSRRQIA